jgi:hypothetical protein
MAINLVASCPSPSSVAAAGHLSQENREEEEEEDKREGDATRPLPLLVAYLIIGWGHPLFVEG